MFAAVVKLLPREPLSRKTSLCKATISFDSYYVLSVFEYPFRRWENMNLILEGRHWMLPTVQSMGNAFLRRYISYIFEEPTAFGSSQRRRFCLAILIFDWQGILTFILGRNIFVRFTSEYSVHIRDRSRYRRTWFPFAASLSPPVRSSIFLIRSLTFGSVPLKTITKLLLQFHII